jgi:hypothetical protein
MIAAMLDGSAVAAQQNNPYSSNDDAHGLEVSTFVLVGSGLLGLGFGLKKARKQKNRTLS